MTISELGDVTFTNNIIGSATAPSNSNYNASTNKPDLTGYAKKKI